ncbi:UNVERIFIED_CONTAM: hypothetical protein GTU68_029113 [Idotea baltica]|nr:hypothetical protein [Idotea baltica]
MAYPKLSSHFYRRSDTLAIARELLGKHLVTSFEGVLTSGRIVETEAYLGTQDRACHAWNGSRTSRTETMYSIGGCAYVYICYGIHHLFNIVTHTEGEPHAILIRGIEPNEGIPIMLERRAKTVLKPNLTAGPGSLARALGIQTQHSGIDLQGEQIWIEDRNTNVSSGQILASSRVGVGYAGDDAFLPYRFRVTGSKWTSPAK